MRDRLPLVFGSAADCSIDGVHRPGNLTIEAHHVIPVSWQQIVWQPAVAPFPGTDPDGRGPLWDTRRVAVCPTHHRNTHALLVKLMRTVAKANTNVIPSIKAGRGHQPELTYAILGLQRFQQVGGSLLDLVAAGQWGEA